MTEHLGRYFTLREMTRTSTGLGNQPPEHIEANLTRLVREMLDPLREELELPIRITSGYRSPEVNAAVGGSRTSRHMTGLAADFKVRGMTARQLVDRIERLREDGIVDYDQAIAYAVAKGGHVHIGLAPEGVTPRRQMLWAAAEGGYSTLG
tara:strand:- start:38 stop:490 length:453 start_codon:yes stop_codon:yes gene_type:complete